jgi:chromosome condensin MukBEF ATPase and DNA-binding subunit MukB
MQRRDYLVIANAVRRTHDQTLEKPAERDDEMRALVRQSHQTMTEFMARGFARINPRFNTEAFLFNCRGKGDSQRAAAQLTELGP